MSGHDRRHRNGSDENSADLKRSCHVHYSHRRAASIFCLSNSLKDSFLERYFAASSPFVSLALLSAFALSKTFSISGVPCHVAYISAVRFPALKPVQCVSFAVLAFTSAPACKSSLTP